MKANTCLVKDKTILLFLLLLCIPSYVVSQSIHRNQWTMQPRIGSSSLALGRIADLTEAILLYQVADVRNMSLTECSEFWSKNSWYIPEIITTFPIYHLDALDGTKISHPIWWRNLLWGDYSHSFKITAGYECSWKSMVSPFGAYLGLDWEYEKFLLENSENERKHQSYSIVPSVGLRIRAFGGRFDRKIQPAIEIGAAYVYRYKYNNPADYRRDALNNGIRGKASLGVDFPISHMAVLIEFKHDFFNYFNKDYRVNGRIPFADFNSSYNELSFRISRSF